MKTIHVSLETLAHHLRVAAVRYQENAAELRKVNELKMAELFEAQQKECRDVADALDNATAIEASDAGLTIVDELTPTVRSVRSAEAGRPSPTF